MAVEAKLRETPGTFRGGGRFNGNGPGGLDNHSPRNRKHISKRDNHSPRKRKHGKSSYLSPTCNVPAMGRRGGSVCPVMHARFFGPTRPGSRGSSRRPSPRSSRRVPTRTHQCQGSSRRPSPRSSRRASRHFAIRIKAARDASLHAAPAARPDTEPAESRQLAPPVLEFNQAALAARPSTMCRCAAAHSGSVPRDEAPRDAIVDHSRQRLRRRRRPCVVEKEAQPQGAAPNAIGLPRGALLVKPQLLARLAQTTKRLAAQPINEVWVGHPSPTPIASPPRHRTHGRRCRRRGAGGCDTAARAAGARGPKCYQPAREDVA